MNINPEENTELDLNDPNISVLDCNYNEKLIIEFNNHISLSEYELARPLLCEIIAKVPKYFELFFNSILLEGIPQKWILNDNFPTSSHYLWILYQDYINLFSKQPNCPKIIFEQCLLNSNEYDLLIADAFYNSYQNNSHFQIKKHFLIDLRNLFNLFQANAFNLNFCLPPLRLLSPKCFTLEISAGFYSKNTSINFDKKESEGLFINLQNLILTQPKLSSYIIEKLLNLCDIIISKNEKKENMFLERILIIYVNFIMLFIKDENYDKVYEFLKYIHYNKSLQFHKNYTLLLLCVIEYISTYQEKGETPKPEDTLKFILFCIETTNLTTSNQYISNFKDLSYFTGKDEHFILLEPPCENKTKSILIKSKILISLLSNYNKEIFSLYSEAADLFLKYSSCNRDFPLCFDVYENNLRENVNKLLSYNEFSKMIFHIGADKQSMWNKSSKIRFWNEYLNFLRINNKHCLEYVLSQSLHKISNNHLSKALTLLQPFNNLKPLIILLAWNLKGNNILFRKSLLECFWKGYLTSKSISTESNSHNTFAFLPFIENSIEHLNYLINFSLWANSSSKKCNQIYDDLLQYSIPYVIQNDLANFNYDNIYNYFINNFPIMNRQLQNSHFHTMMFLFSFYFLHFVFEKVNTYLHNYSDNPKEQIFLFSETDKLSMKKQLNKIVLFPYRINVLYNLLDLAFMDIKLYIRGYSNINNFTIFHKNLFMNIFYFILDSLEPFKLFNKNLNRSDVCDLKLIFTSEYIDNEVSQLIINKIQDLTLLVKEFPIIDNSYTGNKNINEYCDYLLKKQEKLILTINKLKYRFEAVNIPWQEVIYRNNWTNISFLDRITQHNNEYIQLYLKYHRYNKATEFLQVENLVFKNKEELLNKIDIYKEIDLHKEKLKNNEFETFEELLQFDKKFIMISNDFDKFKFLFEIYLSVPLSQDKRTKLLAMIIIYLNKSQLDDELKNKIISSVNGVSKILGKKKEVLSLDKDEQHSKSSFYDIITSKNAMTLPYKELKESFSQNTTCVEKGDYLKKFLTYLMTIGDFFHSASFNFGDDSNYLVILNKMPKEIVTELLFKYQGEQQALEIAKITETNLVEVFLEYTKYYQPQIIKFNEFNNYFESLVNGTSYNKNNLVIKGKWISSSKNNIAYPVSLRLLEFIYTIKQNQKNYFPLLVSLYRVDFDALKDEEQLRFWELVLLNIKQSGLYTKYLYQVFFGFYLGRLVEGNTNEKWDKLFSLIEESQNKVVKENDKDKNIKVDLPKPIDETESQSSYREKLEISIKEYIPHRRNRNYKIYNLTANCKRTIGKVRNEGRKINSNGFHHTISMSYSEKTEYYYNLCKEYIKLGQFDLAMELAERHLDSMKTQIRSEVLSQFYHLFPHLKPETLNK